MTDVPMPDNPQFAKRTRLALNAAAPAIAIMALNAVAMIVGWGVNLPTFERLPKLAPPGWLSGLAWIVIFAAWGVARWEACRVSQEACNRSRWVKLVLAGAVTYVFLAGALGPGWGLAHNAVVLALAAIALARIAPVAHKATLWLALPVAWLGYTTILSIAILMSR